MKFEEDKNVKPQKPKPNPHQNPLPMLTSKYMLAIFHDGIIAVAVLLHRSHDVAQEVERHEGDDLGVLAGLVLPEQRCVAEVELSLVFRQRKTLVSWL